MTPEHLVTFAKLMERRRRIAGDACEVMVAVGERLGVLTRRGHVAPFCVVNMADGEAFAPPEHDLPDPRYLGNVDHTLADAHRTGELTAMREEMRLHAATVEAAKLATLN